MLKSKLVWYSDNSHPFRFRHCASPFCLYFGTVQVPNVQNLNGINVRKHDLFGKTLFTLFIDHFILSYPMGFVCMFLF